MEVSTPSGAGSGDDDGALAERVVQALMPRFVEHLVPACMSKFDEAVGEIWEKVWAAQEQSQRETLEKMQALLAQQFPHSSRAIVNVNCSARRAEDRRGGDAGSPSFFSSQASVAAPHARASRTSTA